MIVLKDKADIKIVTRSGKTITTNLPYPISVTPGKAGQEFGDFRSTIRYKVLEACKEIGEMPAVVTLVIRIN